MELDYMFIYEDERDVGLLVGYLRSNYSNEIFIKKDSISLSGMRIILAEKTDDYDGHFVGIRLDGIFTSFDIEEIDEEQKQNYLYPSIKTQSIFANNDFIRDISTKIGKNKFKIEIKHETRQEMYLTPAFKSNQYLSPFMLSAYV